MKTKNKQQKKKRKESQNKPFPVVLKKIASSSWTFYDRVHLLLTFVVRSGTNKNKEFTLAIDMQDYKQLRKVSEIIMDREEIKNIGNFNLESMVGKTVWMQVKQDWKYHRFALQDMGKRNWLET